MLIRPFCLLAVLVLATGCFRTRTPGLEASETRDGGSRDRNRDGRAGSPSLAPDAGSPNTPAAEEFGCIRDGYCAEIDTEMFQSADLLFVVDNSGSMRQEQLALRDQFPKLIDAITTGRTSSGGLFPPIRDLHLGVVSTDMGLAGIANNFPSCNTQRHVDGGDDGVLLHPGGTGPGCATAYPPFLSFQLGRDDRSQLAVDFGCIATLGTTGCGFEQQLEAALKALWPRAYIDANGNEYSPEQNPILFLSTTSEGRFGHGDVPIQEGGNAGFLRPDSLLGIVIVTDEEDCSARSTAHFISTNDPANPLSRQGLNLRCFYNKQNLFEIDRYVKGFQELRPGREDDFVFAAIVGVPPDLVSSERRDAVDFRDAAARDAYYDNILSDPRMTEVPRHENVPAIAALAPSCTRTDAYGETADAYPPRRIVEVARELGKNATVQSICQDDFGPAIDGLLELTKEQTQLDCMSRALRREADGTVACDVFWELPRGGVIEDCDALPFLSDVRPPRAKRGPGGGLVCSVAQLPVTTVGAIPRGEGFYYDDYTNERELECRPGSVARIAFSEGARPPRGVRAFVDCSPKADE